MSPRHSRLERRRCARVYASRAQDASRCSWRLDVDGRSRRCRLRPAGRVGGREIWRARTETENESLRETIANLANENQLLKRRVFGNKTERGQTSELQLALGNLLDADQRLQKQLDEAIAKAAADGQSEVDTTTATEKPKGKPTGRRNLLASNLPRFLIEIFDEDLEKQANESDLKKRST